MLLNNMMKMPKQTKEERLAKKYAQKTPEEMEKEQDELEMEYSVRCVEMDQKIQNFSSKTDPLMINGEKFAMVRRPTASQNRRIIPPELAKYRTNPEDIPYEVAMKYEDDVYKLMAELIIEPKHSAEWWRNNTGGEFMAAFQAHLAQVNQKLQETIDSFLQQT